MSRSYCDESTFIYALNFTNTSSIHNFHLPIGMCACCFFTIHQPYTVRDLKKKKDKNTSTHMLLKEKKKVLSPPHGDSLSSTLFKMLV